MSPSSRGRGLKFAEIKTYIGDRTVALFTRAWIEIALKTLLVKVLCCRPLHEGVD